MSKSGLNLAENWLFTSVIQDTNVIVDLKLLTTGTNVTGKKIKSGLELVRMETDVATHTYASSFKTKPEHWDINIVLL